MTDCMTQRCIDCRYCFQRPDNIFYCSKGFFRSLKYDTVKSENGTCQFFEDRPM